MARLSAANEQRARALVALYPRPRSALMPVLHLAQEQDGWLTPEAMEHAAELLGLTPAEVYGTASFYDMFFTKPVGRHLVSVCTNIACLLAGGAELLEHAESALGVKAGGTTADGQLTLEEVECIALCDRAPAVAVNWRYFGPLTPGGFDTLCEDLRAGRLADTVPPHGTLCRVRRAVGLPAGVAPEGRPVGDEAPGPALAERRAAKAADLQHPAGADGAPGSGRAQAPGGEP